MANYRLKGQLPRLRPRPVPRPAYGPPTLLEHVAHMIADNAVRSILEELSRPSIFSDRSTGNLRVAIPVATYRAMNHG